MRKRILAGFICCSLSVLSLVGCGHSQDAKSAAAVLADESSVKETSTAEMDPYAEYDHVIEVDGVEIGLKDIEGYKPYVIDFYNEDNNYTNGNAYFRSRQNDITSLDDAKKNGIIAEYELKKQEDMLVVYVNENENGLSLMPAPNPAILGEYFEGNIEAYALLWYNAAIEKIGAGNEYQMVDLSPDNDFTNDEFVCVKKVRYEVYLYDPNGGYSSLYYYFVQSVNAEEYTITK